MAAPKIDKRHQPQLLEWLAAGYQNKRIRELMKTTKMPVIGDTGLGYYRTKWREEIVVAIKARHDEALSSGLALKAERVKRLCDHADEIEARRLELDKILKPSWAAEWRATLEDIAAEMGDRRGAKDGTDEASIKVYVNIDPARI